MIDRKSRILVIALVLIMLGADVAALLLHNVPSILPPHRIPNADTLAVFGFPASVLLAWGFIWLAVKFSCNNRVELVEAYARFYGRCLVLMAVWMMAFDLYLTLFVPLGGGNPPAQDSINRIDVVISGLVVASLGNVVPKLPYQQHRSWLEIGPERTYKLNRFGGWLMVMVGGAEIAAGLCLPLENSASLYAIVAVATAAILLPYFRLYYRYRQSYRRETGGAI